jgi:hypothetical protein
MTPRGLSLAWWVPVAAGLLVLGSFRWARPRWIMVPAALQLLGLALTRDNFGQSALWQQSFDRLYLALPLIALAAFLREPWFARRLVRVAAAAAGVVVLAVGWPVLRDRTTEQLEYEWIRGALEAVSPRCLVVYVGQVGTRNVTLPIYGPPARPGRKAVRLVGDRPEALAPRLAGSSCTCYVRTSLCSSVEGRPACAAVEAQADLHPVASRRLPATDGDGGRRFDRPSVEVVLYEVTALR